MVRDGIFHFNIIGYLASFSLSFLQNWDNSVQETKLRLNGFNGWVKQVLSSFPWN